MKPLFYSIGLAVIAVLAAYGIAYALTQNFSVVILSQVFNCSSGFSSSGTCGVSLIGAGGQNFALVGSEGGTAPSLSGSTVILVPGNSTHAALNLNYQTAVNVQQFSTTFTYVPNGENMGFILTNNTNSSSAGTGKNFTAGASCEGSFFQGFPGVPNNTFAIQLDQFGSLTGGGSTFTYSSVQYYVTGANASNAPNPPGQSPCNPDLCCGSGFTYHGVNKVSTSPVPLNSPSGTINTTTGDTYSVTVIYDGSNLIISLYDVTAGGSCPSATTCFTYTWTNVNIPSIVGANTAFAGFGGGTGSSGSQIPTAALLVNTWSYSGCASC